MLTALLAYGVGLGLSVALGYRMYIPYWYFQFLDVRLLETRLWESIYYLHSQPPLMNLGLAAALHLEKATGWDVLATTLVFHILLGMAAVPAFVYTAAVLLPDALRRRLLIGLLVFHPVFYAVLFNYFYTFHELVILALLPCAAHAYLRTRSPRPFAAVCALLAILCYTRSLFHFVWALAIPLFLMLTLRQGAASATRRRPAAEAALFLVLTAVLLAWPMKNKIVFDSFTYSTWQGYSVSKKLLTRLPLDKDIERPAPPPEFDIPALAWDEKYDPIDSGIPARNWNHYALIGDFKDRQRRAIEVLKKEPWLLVKRMGYHYWCFSRFTGRHPYTAQFSTMANPLPVAVDPWMRLYEALLVQELRSPLYLRNAWFRDEPTRWWHVSGFFFTFPLIAGFAVWKIARRWRSHPLEARTAALMLFSVLWVFAMVILVDGDEANRIRASTEPQTIMLAFWVIPPAFFEALKHRGRAPRPAEGVR